MKIGLALSTTPAYSETFFINKIKGLIEHDIDIVLFVQENHNDFDLCKVIKAPKVHKNHLLQLINFIWVMIKLIPQGSAVLSFYKLEKSNGHSFKERIKKIYLNAHMLSQRLDWLHFGFATQAIGSELVAKAIHSKMAVSFRGFDIDIYPLKHPNCYNALWQHVDKVHSISNYLLHKAYDLGLDRNKPYMIITPAVKPLNDANLELPQNNSRIKLLTISRLHWIKGLETSIEAVKLLKSQGIDFEYHIVGDGNIKETERYQFLVKEYELQDDVIFHGKLSHQDTLKFLEFCDIYLQPSISEGFCNAVLEAQSYGKTLYR